MSLARLFDLAVKCFLQLTLLLVASQLLHYLDIRRTGGVLLKSYR